MHTIDQQLRDMLRTPGVRGVCLVDWRGGRALTSVGRQEPASLVETAAMLRALHDGPQVGGEVEDVIVTDGARHLLFAVVRGSELCVQVQMERDRGSLGFTLRRLRGLARVIEVPLSQDDLRLPPRRRKEVPSPRTRDPVAVDKQVLERVLDGLRSLSSGRPRIGAVVV